MIEFRNVSFKYSNENVIDNLSVIIPNTGIMAIVAPSGVGKTTFLRLISGLLAPNSGNITGVPENISYVFQEQRLLPWFSAFENVKCICKNASDEDVSKTLLTLGISEDLWCKRPDELSGGQNQRVCIARALLYGGDILLLDEPFTGLDADNRKKAMSLIRDFAKTKPVVLVSHIEDDIECADNIIKL